MVKVLYVEDEPFLAKIVKETLESRSFDVTHLDHGEGVLETFTQFQPDICVLDVMLPGKNGFELSKEISAVDSHVPILFLTAKSQTEDVLAGFEAGGNDYIKKPFSMEELIVRINNLLKLKQSQSKQDLATTIQITTHTSFSFKEMKLHIDEMDIQLSHKESLLMKMLCAQPNIAIDRKDILMEIWGDDSYFNSRNLDVYMRKVRKHLTADDQIEIITLKGIGYRFLVK